MTMQHSIRQRDADALVHNFDQVKKNAPHSKILSMIKSNAYGHGMLWAATLLKNSDGFGVALLSDAIKLREAGIAQKILLLRGIYSHDELALAQQFDIDVVVHAKEQIDLICAEKPVKLNIWLKVNVGMNRLGFQPEEIPEVYHKLNQYNIILMTHFSSADELQNPLTQHQAERFNKIEINTEKSLAHSAGILGWKEYHADWVRPGLMLYGVSPFPNTSGVDFNLKPVMTWRSSLIAVRKIKQGEAVGYNGTYISPENMSVGIVGVGYGMGYPRHAKNGTPILVNGIRAEVVGRVSMDMLAVNLQHIPHANIGDEVILWGQDLPVEKVAAHTATSAYELLCNSHL